MSVAVRAGIKRVVKMTAMSALTSAVAVLGGPIAAGLVTAIVVLLLALCWVLNDHKRTGRLVKLIQAVRGTTPRPPRDRHRPRR